MGIMDWIRRNTLFTPEEVEEKPSIALDPRPIHINPTPDAKAARDAARLGRLLEYTGGVFRGGDQAIVNEITILRARIAGAGYAAPTSASEAAELSKQLGG